MATGKSTAISRVKTAINESSGMAGEAKVIVCMLLQPLSSPVYVGGIYSP